MERIIYDRLIDTLTNDYPELDVRTDYVGRGPTEPCLGIVVPSLDEWTQILLTFALSWDDVHVEDLASALQNGVRTDSMGREMIIYFPGIRPAELS